MVNASLRRRKRRKSELKCTGSFLHVQDMSGKNTQQRPWKKEREVQYYTVPRHAFPHPPGPAFFMRCIFPVVNHFPWPLHITQQRNVIQCAVLGLLWILFVPNTALVIWSAEINRARDDVQRRGMYNFSLCERKSGAHLFCASINAMVDGVRCTGTGESTLHLRLPEIPSLLHYPPRIFLQSRT